MRCLKQRFEAFTRGDAYLSRRAFKDITRLLVDESKVPESYYDFLFLAFDVDHDHHITLEEFAITLGQLLRGTDKELKRLAFSMMDFDNNGSLSSDELVSMLQGDMGSLMKADLEPLFDLLVSNYVQNSSKMVLTFNEFERAIKGRPKILDVFRPDAADLLGIPLTTSL
jgi:Ca2+-binding EF-hand superfamily protein